jgi:tripartite ATP-independent transporter DctM subunit
MSLAFGLFIVSFLAFLAIGVPVAFCMGIASAVYLVLADTANLTVVYARMASSMQSFLYVAVAFFILASNLMNTSGISDRIFAFADSLVGHVRGGLAQVNVLSSVIFSGMTGTALGDAAGLGRIEIKAMVRAGYKPEFAAAITISSAVIGPIIPPSMIMIIYAELAEVSIAALFLGGVIPGLIIGLSLGIYIYFAAAKNGPPPLPRATWPERLVAFRRAIPPLLSPVLIVGGLVGGFFTPTEASIMAAAYALLLGFIYRTASVRDMWDSLREAALGTAMPLFVVTTALLFSWIITVERIPYMLVDVLGGSVDNWVLIILLINLLLLGMGMVIESLGIMILMIPILKPIALAAGIDLVHLGVFMSINLMIGMITPPVGLSLFVACEITGRPIGVMSRAALPFLIPLVAALLLVSLVPQTVTWLPNLILN